MWKLSIRMPMLYFKQISKTIKFGVVVVFEMCPTLRHNTTAQRLIAKKS